MSRTSEPHDRLREERLRLGYNQTDFASLAGTTQRSQTGYETGKRSPDLNYLVAIAAIGVDVQYIVTGRRNPPAASLTAMETAIATAFEMVRNTGVEVTAAQFAQMVRTLMPKSESDVAQTSAREPIGSITGHGNMVASGSDITQVGGRISISRRSKLKSN